MDGETYGLSKDHMRQLQAEIDFRRQALKIESLHNKKKAFKPLNDFFEIENKDFEDEEKRIEEEERLLSVINLSRDDIQKELEAYTQSLKQRITMSSNKQVDPILDVFDML